MRSLKLEDGTYATTPFFMGGDKSEFLQHEEEDGHHWKLIHSDTSIDGKEFLAAEMCDCGGLRSRFKIKEDYIEQE